MASPTLQKTWEFDVNNNFIGSDQYDLRQKLLLGIKNALIDGVTFTVPWTVRYSCDSTTAGSAGDGVDHWSASTDVVWEPSGSVHSWIVLRQTDYFGSGNHLEMLIDCEQGASGDNYAAIGVYLSNTAFSGGTTGTRPTATGEWSVIASGGSEVTSNWQGLDSVQTTKSFHMMASDDGEEWRILISDNTYVVAIWAIGKPLSPPSGWSPACWALIYGQDTNSSTVTTDTNLSTAGTLRVRCTDDTRGDFQCLFTAESMASSATQPVASSAVANTFDASRPFINFGLYSSTGAATGYMGGVKDMWWSLESDGTGATYPVAQPDFINVGGLCLPWDGATTPNLG
jgi:hypothetical protein